MKPTILVTGGTGFIGSHTALALVEAGYQPIILDNLCNSHRAVLERLERISQSNFQFILGDIRDRVLLDQLFQQHAIKAVIHFAALKAVGESVEKPLAYYNNNLQGTITLLEAMQAANIKHFVFSSSATVYGDPATTPIYEHFPRSATNPYGRSKLIVEDILEDLQRADKSWKIARLRYFNPVGAHKSGLIGEDPQGIPNNLMPYIAQVAAGRRKYLQVFGQDYPTEDGTGVRDYIHVLDLADGHIAALNYLFSNKGSMLTVNLGTGRGVSVYQMIRAFEQASGKKIPYRVTDRRAGDIAECWADVGLAKKLLHWEAKHTLEEMCADAWRWQEMNPKGFLGYFPAFTTSGG